MSWDILRKKKYDTIHPSKVEIITLVEWQEYVDSDPELIWAELSPMADAYRAEGKEWVAKSRLKHEAYYELNKTGYGNLRFKFFRHFISIDCERQTLKRVEKMWQVAKYFDAYLFKNGIRFTEKKLEKLREQYRIKKEGRRAPKEKK